MAISGRIVNNSVAGGTCVYCSVGGFGPGILRAFGRIQAAADLEWLMILFVSDAIQWGAVFRLGFLITFLWLVGVNWELVRRAYQGISETVKEDWSATARDAVFYIAHKSYLGVGLTDQGRFREAVDAINDAVQTGKVRLRGRKPDSFEWGLISKREAKNGVIPPNSLSRKDDGMGGVLVKKDDEKTILYIGLLTNPRKIKKLWPQLPPTGGSWMAAE